jgi:hypothetical protein
MLKSWWGGGLQRTTATIVERFQNHVNMKALGLILEGKELDSISQAFH